MMRCPGLLIGGLSWLVVDDLGFRLRDAVRGPRAVAGRPCLCLHDGPVHAY